MRHIHTIPVRPGTTPQETWAELLNVGVLSPPCPPDCDWALVPCNGEQCHRIPTKVTA